MNGTQFRALKFCNGKIDTLLPFITDEERAIIHDFEAKGFVEPCVPGQALTENQKYKKFPVRYIGGVHWSITASTGNCYISAPEAVHGELPHDVIMSFIPQFEECGIMKADLTGG